MNRTGAMQPSLFRSGLAPRLAAAAIFGALAFAAVFALEPRAPARGLSTSPAPQEPRAPARGPSTLCIESLQPVASWAVRIDGAALAPLASSATAWIAEVPLSLSATLVVDAAPAADSAAARNALRIRIAGTGASFDETFWCAREWSVTTRAADLTASTRPLAPADLP